MLLDIRNEFVIIRQALKDSNTILNVLKGERRLLVESHKNRVEDMVLDQSDHVFILINKEIEENKTILLILKITLVLIEQLGKQ